MKICLQRYVLPFTALALGAAMAICPAPLMAAPGQGLTVSCQLAATGQVGISFNSALTATGGTSPYTFTLFDGAVPSGLALTSNGTISGTPTATGAFSFIPEVTDATGTSVANFDGCGISIQPAPNVSLACPVATGTVGIPYGSSLTAVGGLPPYTFSVLGALPTGLSLLSGGVISGTPTVPGTIVFTGKVVDSSGSSASNTVTTGCTIVIAPSPNVCGLSPGYWKNHSPWPVTSLVLGDRTYNQAQLLNLLGLPKKGDSSIILAFQLIAAKLNVANGTNGVTAGNNITVADQLLSGFGKPLPYGVKNSQMETIGSNLDLFNADGTLQPGCKMQ